MNNKGFAISGILYSILTLFLILLLLILGNFQSRKVLFDKQKDSVLSKFEPEELGDGQLLKSEYCYQDDVLQEFITPKDGYYQLEIYSQNNGKYISSKVYLYQGIKLYILVGQNGSISSISTESSSAYSTVILSSSKDESYAYDINASENNKISIDRVYCVRRQGSASKPACSENSGYVSISYIGETDTKCIDPIQAGNDPILNNLVPIVYNGTNWVVADTTKDWYNYSKQEWANAAVVKSGTNTTPGTVLSLPTWNASTGVINDNGNILQMYVWIPRYSYTIKSEDGTNYYGKTLSNLGGSTASKSTPGAIDIKFVSTSTKETGTAKYTGNTPTNYYTHPSFTFGTDELSGIWVGKFETSHTTLSSSNTENNLNCVVCKYGVCQADCVQSNGSNSAEGLRILPNVISLRNNNVSNFFFVSRAMNNLLGFSSSNTDTHLMKNDEWGAVAYLSQSIYGKYGNPNYTGADKEIYMNDSSSYYTGKSSGLPPANGYSSNGTYSYNVNLNGTGASTTGNIYGIYDMSGGAWEISMSVFADTSGKPRSGQNSSLNSGFNGALSSGANYTVGIDFPNSKYYNLYKAGTTVTDTAYKGHALGEVSGWYGDKTGTWSPEYPWFHRGSNFFSGTFTGVLGFNTCGGYSIDSNAARLVLAPIQ